MKIILMTVLLAANVTAAALDIKGVSPGQPWEPQTIEDKLNADAPEARVRCDRSMCSGKALYGSCVGHTLVTLKDGVVASISVLISVNCYDQVVQLMLVKYGQASNSVHQVKQNGFGARLDDIIIAWQKGDQTLLYDKYSSIDQSTILLTGPQAPEKTGSL